MAGETKVHIRQLGQVGLITDKPPHELPTNVWSRARNARFRDNFVQRIGGYISTMPGYTAEPKGLTYFNNTWNYGSTTELWQFEPGAVPEHQLRFTVPAGQDVTDAHKWTFSEFSGLIIASHPDCDPVFWNGVTPSVNAYVTLPDWGTNGTANVTWRAERIRSFKNVLIALNTTEDGEEFQQRIRWSDIALPNQPPAEWNPSTTNSAGFTDLTDATSRIVDGYVLGDTFVVYTKNEVFVLDYVGGNKVFQVRQAFNDVGCIREGCIASFNSQHLVVGINDVYIHNGSSKQSVITNRIKENFFEQVKDFEYDAGTQYDPRIEALTYTALNEIWIFFSTELREGDSRAYFSTAAIWNYVDNTWTYTDVPLLTDVANGGLPITEVLRWDNADTFRDEPITWDNSVPLTWDGGGKDIEERVLIGCGKDGFDALDQRAEASETIVPFSLERQKIDFDENVKGMDISQHKTVMSLYPQFTGSGIVSVRMGFSYTPNQEPEWKQPVFFNIDTDYKADFRITGRYFSIRIEALDDNDWKLEGIQYHIGGIGQMR